MKQVRVWKGSVSVWLRYLALSLLALGTAAAPPVYAQSGTRDRILEPVDASRFSATRGSLHPSARPEFDRGELSPATRLGRVTMFFSRTQEQDADLQTLLAQLQDRSSVNYHRWLSPEEFAGRFGLSHGDLGKIVAWLQTQGLTIEQVSRSRTWVAFSGTARQVEAALRTDLRRYAVRGQMHFAMSHEPSLPNAFANVVLGFRGLDDFRLKPRVKKLRSRFTSGVTGNHFLAPGDLATIYNLAPLYSGGISGTGQKVAIAGQSAIDVGDVQTFRSLSGLSVNNPQVILVPQATTGDADPGMVDGDIDEAYLDVEWAGAVARNATILYVYSQNVLDAFTYIIDQNLAPVLSISYGLCEGGSDGFTQSDANIVALIAQQGNAQGITIVAPSGDAGAADCDIDVSVAEQGLSVDLPGALPYVTSVGGTRFSGDASDPPVPSGYWGSSTTNPNTALSYIPETSWNDTSASSLAATGGGSSIYFPKPSWQTGTGVPKDGARDVPDLSFSASGDHDGYLVCSRDASTNSPTCVVGFRMANGLDLTVFGGTSAGVPVFAGIVALLNQVANTPAGQGNINPRLYALAAASPSSFHDITTGDNKVPFRPSTLGDCTPASTVPLGYTAGTGYDLVTGLGSIDGHSFVTTWTSITAPASGPNVTADFQLSLSPSTLIVKRGACGTTQLTLTRPNGFAGTPTFTCSAAAPLTAVTCSVSPVASAGVVVPQRFPALRWWLLAVLAVAICLWLELARQTQRLRVRAPGFALACLLVMIIGCSGGGDSGTLGTGGSGSNPDSNYVFTVDAPASAATGTGTVTVTGALGGVTRTVQLAVTVN
jgi:subtilase family serine protease